MSIILGRVVDLNIFIVKASILMGCRIKLAIGQQIVCREPTNWGGIIVDSLKVSSRSNPNSVAGALVAVIREQGYVEMQAVGAGALNQAVKAVAIARGFVAPSGTDLICAPAFADITIAGEDRTALKLLVEKRQR